jgi:hypothetical protein
MGYYNVEADVVDLIFTQCDTIDMSFSVYLNDVLYDMTGMQLDMQVRKTNGDLVRSFTSSGGTPAITIATTTFNIYSTGFTRAFTYNYDVQLTDGADIMTIMKGRVIVKKERTL